MLTEELTQITNDLTPIIEAIKQYKLSPEDYETNIMAPRLGKRNFMDLFDELRAKQGRLAVYANREEYHVDRQDVKTDIVKSLEILQENIVAIKSVTDLSEALKNKCQTMFVRLENVMAMNELRNTTGNKPRL